MRGVFLSVKEEWLRRREAQPNLWRLVCAYRDHGHRVADLDPLQLTPRSGEEGKEREGEGGTERERERGKGGTERERGRGKGGREGKERGKGGMEGRERGKGG